MDERGPVAVAYPDVAIAAETLFVDGDPGWRVFATLVCRKIGPVDGGDDLAVKGSLDDPWFVRIWLIFVSAVYFDLVLFGAGVGNPQVLGAALVDKANPVALGQAGG